MISFPSEALAFCNTSHQGSVCQPLTTVNYAPQALELPLQLGASA